MSVRPFVGLSLFVGLALCLAWAGTAQGEQMAFQPDPPGTSVSPSAVGPGPQGAASLSYTAEVSFTPVITLHLPSVSRDDAGCSTVPTLIGPPNGANLSTIAPLFEWNNNNDPQATSLILEVATNPAFTLSVSELETSGSGEVKTFRFGYNLSPATTHYWRAHLTCGTIQAPYSGIWSFTTGSSGTLLPGPALIAPGDGSTVAAITVLLQWSATSGALDYRVCWRRVGQAGRSCAWRTNTEYTVSELSANTTYEWWVSARNDYAIGNQSAVWRFTTPAGSAQ